MVQKTKKLIQLKKFLDKNLDKNLEMSKLRILTEAIFDDIFLNRSLKFYNSLKKISYSSLKDLFINLIKYSKEYLIKSSSENFKLRFENFQKSLAYFCLLESILEDSKIVIDILENIKKSNNNYLNDIQKLDSQFLSLEHKTKIANAEYAESLQNVDIDENLEKNLRLYLLFKQWQDITHYFYLANFEKQNIELYKIYLNTEKEHFLMNFQTVSKRIIESFKNKFKLSDYLDAFVCGFKSEIIEHIGGKGYGLLVLLSLGENIPKTFIISHSENIDESLKIIPNNLKKYALRSSGNIEDGNKNSFAGMFDSYLNLDFLMLPKYILKVRQSIDNSRSMEYRKTNNLEKPKMNVLVQEYIEADFSGVWISDKKNSGALEWVKGSCEKLVSGKVKPNFEHFNNKNINRGIVIGNTSVANILNKIQNKILRVFKTFCDFEWCVKLNKLYLLQYRPTTTGLLIPQEQTNQDDNLIYGTPASSGKKTGEIKFIKTFTGVETIEKNKILLTYFTDPEWLPLMKKTSCIITAMGGFLSHTAIIARELGIVCVTGIGKNNFKKLINCKTVEVNGDLGLIKIIDN